MTPRVRIMRLSAAFLASNMTRAAIGFGVTLVLGRGLGAAGFGRWILCTTWASSLTVIADLGFGVLLTRDAARPDAPAGRLVASALAVRLVVAVPLGVMLYVSAAWIAAAPESIAGLRLAALLGIGGAVYGCFGATLRSQPRWLPAVLGVETAWLAVQLLGSWWIVHSWSDGSRGPDGLGGWGAGWLAGSGRSADSGGTDGALVWLMLLAIAVQVAQIASALALWRPVFGESGRARADREPLVALMRRALPFAISGLVANAQARVGPLMLGSLSTSVELGLFAAASRFGRFACLAPQAVFAGALPVLTHEYARDRAGAHRVVQTFDRALLATTAAFAAGCLLLARPLLARIYGASFVAGAAALVWVAIGLIPALTNSARRIALYAAGGESVVVRWSVVALVVQIVSAAVLIPAVGGTGAAIALALGEAAVWLPLRHAVSTIGLPAFARSRFG
jgi:O-antigen/teichoic acid export membrane protein